MTKELAVILDSNKEAIAVIEQNSLDVCERVAVELKEPCERVAKFVVNNDETYATAALMIKSLKNIFKTAETRRKALKEPYVERGKKIDASFALVTTLISSTEGKLRGTMERHAEEKERERARQQREQDEAILRASEKAASRGDTLKANAIIERGSELTVAKENVKTEGATISHTLVFASVEIEDFAIVPDQYKMLDESAVRKDFAFKKGDLHIPGLKITSRQSVKIR